MRISGISLKNGSRLLWIPSDSNDRFGFRVEARSATVARDTRRRWFGGWRWSVEENRGKKTTAVPVSGSHYCKTRMDDIRGPAKQRGEESRGRRRRCQLRDRARRATPDLLARNFSRERELLRERNRKGAEFGEERMDVSSSRLFANFGNIRSSTQPCPPLSTPAVAMNRLSYP